MVPLDNPWFKTSNIVTYLFPGVDASTHELDQIIVENEYGIENSAYWGLKDTQER
jgi:hypothetical protein